jgi:putative ABC transport system permease protein
LVKALNRKLLRDLRHSWQQVVSITSVLAAGIASFVSLQGTMIGLDHARRELYQTTGFAGAEVRLHRAPDPVLRTLTRLPGVRAAESRVVIPAVLPKPGDPLPPIGELVSLPTERGDALNRLILLQGRWPERDGEALLLARFAERQRVLPGDRLTIIVQGTQRTLRVSGLATSAEFIIPRAGAATGLGGDEGRYAVLWIPHQELAAMAGYSGAFNDVLFAIDSAVPWLATRAAIDAALASYGGLGAVEQLHQGSEEILRGEFDQLRGLAFVLPVIFLCVAAFLVNVVVSRLITLQRAEIAALSALGYATGAIVRHYLAFVAVIGVLGASVGILAGTWLGRGLIGIYAEYFHLPRVAINLGPALLLTALAESVVACVLGAIASLRTVLRLRPAEAMRPPSPARYRRLLVDRVPLLRRLPPTVRMVARDVERQPARALLSVVGLAAAIGMLIAGRFNVDAIARLLDLQFGIAAREDVSVGFTEGQPPQSLESLRALPGVIRVEGFRAVAVRLRSGVVARDAAIIAYEADAQLRRLVDLDGRVRSMPTSGLALSRTLANVLRIQVGDSVDAQVREGTRRELRLMVTAVEDDMVGMQGYADPRTLAHWLNEAPSYSAAVLQVDAVQINGIRHRLGSMGNVTGYTTREAIVRQFRDMMARTTGTMTLVESIFAAIIAAGLVYNSARVALSTRGRDLASLRVLGFTRNEISGMLLGEQAGYLLASLPLGLITGRWFVRLLMSTIHTERVRIPPVVSIRTDAFAVTIVVLTACLTAALIHRKIGHLDLIAVLKTRE